MEVRVDDGGRAGGARRTMFEVVDQGDIAGAFVVRGGGHFAGKAAIFVGPEARERAEAYARWLNAGVALQRRRTDPGFRARTDHDP